MTIITRRQALIGGLAGSGLLLTGCSKIFHADALTESASFQRVLAAAQGWTRGTQRFLLSGGQMAHEYKPSDISAHFKANGTLNPGGAYYDGQVAAGFASWRLRVDGLVAHPLSLSVAELRRLPSRSQITRHDCVEG
ncbi:MAG: molybdopterin-dependent oxidoreductase, partial [Acetobacteraceae bacterium]